MSREKIKLSMSLTLMIMSLTIIALYPEAAIASSQKHEVTKITILGSKFGRTSYIQAFALAQIINQRSSWLKATAQETLGSADNIKLADRSPKAKKTSLLIASVSTYARARKAGRGFKKKYDDLRMVASTLRAAHFFGSLDPKIRTYKDMVGKKVAIGPKAGPHGIKGSRMLADCYEILDKVKVINMLAPDIGDAVIDGLVDVGLFTIHPAIPQWMPDESLEALRARHKVYPVPLTLEQAKYGTSKGKYNFLPVLNMPANTLYEGQPETPLSTSVIGFAAYLDLPADVVHEVVRILYTYQPDFVAYHQLMKILIPKRLGEGPFTEDDLHPGAAKFYKEHGLKIGL
ncbi:MAG: TAXI family TRAP transporter solute-binding subunit [Deltaproteobacteria bacterium]|nr:TAXI family TRAP transporter solute-binding subunit [Deltaproteobacteria bacterium]